MKSDHSNHRPSGARSGDGHAAHHAESRAVRRGAHEIPRSERENRDFRENRAPRRDKSTDSRENTASEGFFVCGVHPVEETLSVLPKTILGEARLFIADTRSFTDIQPIMKLVEANHVQTVSCTTADLDLRTGETRHQGVLLEVRAFPYEELDDVLDRSTDKQPMIVVLDQIQDPHNLGAIIRSAAAFGATAVVIPKDRAAQITPTAIKTSAGQAWRVPVCRVTNIAQTLRGLKDAGFVVFGADIEGEPLASIRFDQPCVIVMGSEGDGMRRLTRTLCDQFARIDMNPAVESLNVSVAAAIFLYQASLVRAKVN